MKLRYKNMANKVQFGLSNVYYAILTEADNTAPAYGTPKKLAGAVSLELSQEGAETNFYADNIEYFRVSQYNGYSGSLEMAKITDEALKDIWGFGYDTTNKIVFESADAEAKPFALLFQIEGDANEDLYVLYKCYASRPNVGSTTINENGKEPQTQTVDLTCVPLVDPTGGVMDKKTYAKTDDTTGTTVKNGWFSSVFTGFTATV